MGAGQGCPMPLTHISACWQDHRSTWETKEQKSPLTFLTLASGKRIGRPTVRPSPMQDQNSANMNLLCRDEKTDIISQWKGKDFISKWQPRRALFIVARRKTEERTRDRKGIQRVSSSSEIFPGVVGGVRMKKKMGAPLFQRP